MTNILPVAHSLTGCDTTSSFFDIGKKTVYKILKQNTTKYQTLTNLASSDVDACVEAGRLLVADLYDPKGSAKSVHRDLNKLRVKLALSKDSSLVKLPPSEAAFRQHILRVALQVYVWTHANEAKPPPRSPLEYGWRNENKYLITKYFEGPMTSDFLQDPVCVCVKASPSAAKTVFALNKIYRVRASAVVKEMKNVEISCYTNCR